MNFMNFSSISNNSVKHYLILYETSLSPKRFVFTILLFLRFKNVLKYFLILPDPLFLRFLFDIKILKSCTRSFLKKLVVNFIPDSKKILEKPKFLTFIRTFIKSRLPFISRGILKSFIPKFSNNLIFLFISFIIKNYSIFFNIIFNYFRVHWYFEFII